jgi:hypothetical protein
MSKTGKSRRNGISGAWAIILPVLGCAGVGVTYAYVSRLPNGTRWTVFGTAVAIAGAAALTGGVVGFLFGIPHTVQGSATPAGGTHYQGNTNLEQVSDWLTKIIVGVGLVQVGRLLPALSRLGRNLRAPLGGQSSSAAFGLGLTISYALLGFLFLYLWSRERLPGELAASAIRDAMNERDSQRSAALDLVNRQLDSLKGGSPPAVTELNKAIADAPGSTQVLVFNEAEHVRTASWQNDKPKMELTIPVFRALVAADTEQEHHRSRGALGWALKDQRRPEWQAAAAELSAAIEIRNRLGITGWRLYEANRALCDIELARALPPGDPQVSLLTTQIAGDLAAARTDPYASQMLGEMLATPDVERWMISSGLTA